MTSRTRKYILYTVLFFLLLALVGGAFWWKQPHVEEEVQQEQEQLSEYDLALRAEPLFWTCTEQVQYYWGGVEKKLQEYIATNPGEPLPWGEFMDTMYEFYAFAVSLPFVGQERYQKIVLDRFEQATGEPFHVGLFVNPSLIDYSLKLFEEQVDTYYEVMGEETIALLGSRATLEAFLYADGLLFIDMVSVLNYMSEQSDTEDLERLAQVLGLSWSELEAMVLEVVVASPDGAHLTVYPYGVGGANYHTWMNVIFAPLVLAVADEYARHDISPLTSPFLRRVISSYVDDSERRTSRFYYRPIPFHQPTGKYFEVLRACMTPVLTLEVFYQDHLRLVQEIVQDQPLSQEMKELLQPAKAAAQKYGYTEYFDQLDLGEQAMVSTVYELRFIETARMQQLFTRLQALPTEERLESDVFERLRVLYLDAHVEREENPLIEDEHRVRDIRKKLLEDFINEMGWSSDVFTAA